MRVGMGVTCLPDVQFPNGCPSGFSLQQVYYVPNSEITNVTASTPGAVPVPGAACQCLNSSGMSPLQVGQAQCPSVITAPTSLALIAGAIAALILLPGGWKALALLPAAGVFLYGWGVQYEAQVNAQGQVTCVLTGASGL